MSALEFSESTPTPFNESPPLKSRCLHLMASGARAQKPVGSAAWISTEKENVSQLVEQELEEVEYPVSHEMDWLNEHMAEIFDNNQLCVAITESYVFAILY